MTILQTTDPTSIRRSVHLYNLLLNAYPAPFRGEYGRHMAQVFREACLDAVRRSGSQGLAALWAQILFDWFKSVIEERFTRATDMTRQKFVRLAGWGMMLGAVAMQLSFLVDTDRVRGILYRVYGLPLTRTEYESLTALAEQLGFIPALLGLLLLIFGVAGLRESFLSTLDQRGRDVLILALAGGLIALGGGFGLRFNAVNWVTFVFGISLMFGCMAVFGLFAVKAQLLPAWSGRALAFCFWFPISLLIGLIYKWVSGGMWLVLPSGINSILMTFAFASLVLLGFEVQRGQRPVNNTNFH